METILTEYWQPDRGCHETGHVRSGHPMVIVDKGEGYDEGVEPGHPLSRRGLVRLDLLADLRADLGGHNV